MADQVSIKSLREGDAFLGHLRAQEAAFKVSAKGTEYLDLTLSDATGRIKAFLWDIRAIEGDMDLVRPDAFLKVKGTVTSYSGRLQLKLDKVRHAPDEEIADMSSFFPTSVRPADEMLAELDAFIGSLRDPWLKKLLQTMLQEDAALRGALAKAPAAKQLHHVFIGGLLEHTLSVTRMVDAACRNYPGINRDLAVAAALLHDIGKTAELCYGRSFGYTDDGNLLGHITMEVGWVRDAMSKLDGFPEEAARQLLHILLSHHGKLEFGSPVLPKTPEAILVLYLDDLDGKLESVFAGIRDDGGAGSWTPFNKSLDRMIYKVRLGRAT
jgi:3'-5' exoribonuclease